MIAPAFFYRSPLTERSCSLLHYFGCSLLVGFWFLLFPSSSFSLYIYLTLFSISSCVYHLYFFILLASTLLTPYLRFFDAHSRSAFLFNCCLTLRYPETSHLFSYISRVSLPLPWALHLMLSLFSFLNSWPPHIFFSPSLSSPLLFSCVYIFCMLCTWFSSAWSSLAVSVLFYLIFCTAATGLLSRVLRRLSAPHFCHFLLVFLSSQLTFITQVSSNYLCSAWHYR